MRFHGPRVHLAPPTAASPPPSATRDLMYVLRGAGREGSHSNRPTLHYGKWPTHYHCSLPLTLTGLHSFCLPFSSSFAVCNRIEWYVYAYSKKCTKGPGGKYPRLSSPVSIDWPDFARVFHVPPTLMCIASECSSFANSGTTSSRFKHSTIEIAEAEISPIYMNHTKLHYDGKMSSYCQCSAVESRSNCLLLFFVREVLSGYST